MPAGSALQEQLHFHDGDCITQHSLSKAQFWCRYKKIAHESLPVLNQKAQPETFTANSEFQRKHKNCTVCLERTITYLALFVVSGYFMKYWSWRCKKFFCMSLKNIFFLPQFVPTCFLLQNTLCSGQSSSWEHADCLGSIPGGVQGTSGNGTPGSGVGEKVGSTPRLDSMALEDFSNLTQCLCFLFLFLNNVPGFFFFLSTWVFNDYPDFKKFIYFSPPAQRQEVY